MRRSVLLGCILALLGEWNLRGCGQRARAAQAAAAPPPPDAQIHFRLRPAAPPSLPAGAASASKDFIHCPGKGCTALDSPPVEWVSRLCCPPSCSAGRLRLCYRLDGPAWRSVQRHEASCRRRLLRRPARRRACAG